MARRKLEPDKISVELDVNVSKAQEEIHRLSEATRELKAQNKEYRNEIARLAETEGDHSEAIGRLNDAIRENSNQIRRNSREIRTHEKSIGTEYKTAKQLRKEIKSLTSELENTSRKLEPERYREFSGRLDELRKAYREATGQSVQATRAFMDATVAGRTLTAMFVALTAVVSAFVAGTLRNLVSTIVDFEKANSNLAAVLGTTKAAIRDLTEEALRLGATTSYTASEVTALQTELAKLGFSKQQIKDMEAGVLKFAQAVGTDLASAAAFAGASMRIFDIEAAQVEGMLASLAVGTTKSALSFSYLQTAMSIVGPVAASFGFTIEETIALLGSLANAGFDASSAATASRNIILGLADSSGKLATALGAPVRNLDGLVAGLRKLNDEGIDLNRALELTDKRSVSAFSKFLAGADAVAELRDGVTDATGAFDAMYAEMSDNAATAWDIFLSTVEGVILRFYESRGVIKSVIEGMTTLVEWIGAAIDALSGMTRAITLGAVAIGAYYTGVVLTIAAKKAYHMWTKYVTSATIAETAATRAGSLMLTLHRAAVLALSMAKALLTGNIDKARRAMVLFNAVTAMNPIGLLIAAIGLAVAAWEIFTDKAEDARRAEEAWAEASQEASRRYGEQKSSIEALVMVAENENLSLERRRAAVEELNRIIPGYNAQIDETTQRYTASREALDLYLESMEKEMRYEAYRSRMSELASKAAMARDKYDEAEIKRASAPKYEDHWYGRTVNAKPIRAAREAKKEWEEADRELAEFKDRMTRAIEEGVIAPAVKGAEAVEDLKATVTGTAKDGERRHTPGTYGADSIEQAEAEANAAHRRRLLAIDAEDASKTEKALGRSREMIVYCDELTAALEKMRAETDETHTATIDKIDARLDKVAADRLAAQKEMGNAMARLDKEALDRSLAIIEEGYKAQEDSMREAVLRRETSQEAADLYLVQEKKRTY
ncbi:MAG: phage tail tape measure protein, partial [Duncaniella sp.]|nr:phage tail tape measure protein [Duncaniella sp.]